MTSRLEDLLGKLLMVAVFSWMTAEQVVSVLAIIRLRETIDLWGLVLASRVLGLVFLLLIVWFTVMRLPLMQKVSWDAEKSFTYIVHLTGYTFGITTKADGPFSL